MDDKSATPVPPYEAVSPLHTGVSQGIPSHPPPGPNQPTQYPHPPIPPPGGQHSYTGPPPGSPPPGAGGYGPPPAHSPPPGTQGYGPPPAHSPPPQQGGMAHAPSMGQQQQIHPVTSAPMASPGQEKHEYYAHGQGQPQPQPGQAPPPGPMHQPSQYQTAIPLASLQRTPAPVDCPNCRQRTMTRVEYHSGNYTHVWALVLFCLLCACCVPYLMKGTKDVEHRCGHCGTLLACYHASGHTEVLSYA